MRVNFKDCLEETLKWEGGYSNHPKDPGGKTQWGIIQRVYNSYRRLKEQTPRDVRKITRQEMEEIYKEFYWDKVYGDKLPIGLDLAVFDFTVNSGPVQATKDLQRTLNAVEGRNLVVDGHFGGATLDAATQLHDLSAFINAYQDRRGGFFRKLRTFSVFGKGWLRRNEGVRKAALYMADNGLQIAPVRPETPKELQSTPPQADKTVWTAVGTFFAGSGTAILSAVTNPYALTLALVVAGIASYFLYKFLQDVRLGN